MNLADGLVDELDRATSVTLLVMLSLIELDARGLQIRKRRLHMGLIDLS